jgi:dTDP-4-dehydrorhamnose reductase
MEVATNKSIKILVTGANGQLGRCLQDVAVQYPGYDFHFKSSADLDITSNEDIERLFRKENYSYCINCAAYTNVDKAESDKENVFLVNAEAVKYLAEASKAIGTTLIHISTDFVFDGTKGAPYKEEDTPNPINVYGASKLKGENYIQEMLEKYFIMRTSWLYSEYGHNFVKTMLRLGAEREELSVVDDQVGSPTYAGDLAKIIMEIISSEATNFGVYHYCSEGAISWFDFSKAIFKQNNIQIKVNPIHTNNYPTPARRPNYSVMNISKIKYFLQVEPPSWKQSLNSFLLKFKDIKI